MGRRPRKVSAQFARTGVLAVVACACSLAHADIGSVHIQEIPEFDQSIEAAPVAAPVSTTAEAQVAPSVTEVIEEPMNRQWTLSTPGGPTAFVLDARQLEVGMPVERINQRIWISDAPLLWIGANYGLTDSLTASAATGLNKAALGLKWNFYNGELWSFGAGPRIGYQFRRSDSYWSTRSEMPIGGFLTASRVIDHRHKFHIGTEVARTKGIHTYDEGYSYYSSYSGSSTLQFGRIAGTYEIRLNRRHAMTLWAAVELAEEKEDSSATSMNSDDNFYSRGNTSDNSSTTALYGMGYQYLRESFAAEIGLELGPKWVSSSSNYTYSSEYPSYGYSWSSLSIGGSLTASINYRL